MDLRKVIRSLSAKEAHVLYWKVHGKTDIEIADLAGQKYDWTRKYTRSLYEKFGWKKLPDSEKRMRLVSEAKPIIDEIVGKTPEILQEFPLDPPEKPVQPEKSVSERIKNKLEEVVQPEEEKPQEETPAVAPVVQPPEEPSTVAPSLQPIDRFPEQEKTPPPSPDLYQKPEPVEPKLEPEKPPETQSKTETVTPNRRRLALVGGIALGLCCLVVASAAIFGVPRLFAILTPAPTIPTITEVLPQATLPSATTSSNPSLTPTNSLTDTPLPPTFTPTPTIEPTITATKEYYDQGEYAPLIEGVTMRLQEDFKTTNYADINNPPSFAIQLDVTSEGGQQFVARFDPTNFSAKDDVGTDYPLVEVERNSGFATPLVGVQSIVSAGEHLYVVFHGNFSPDAHYIIITVGPFNGQILVFHKQI